MEDNTRKARVKSLKRILNNLSIEIKELKAKGISDTEDLDHAQSFIARYCEKIWPSSAGSVKLFHEYRTVHSPTQQKAHPPRK